MTFGEKLKAHRKEKGLSQEKLAELVGVSRQAVTKWEANLSLPSSENLLALSSILGVSLDELAEIGVNEDKEKTRKAILHANLTLIAIILQASALNVCIQPWESGKYYSTSVIIRLSLLLCCSVWMALNLRHEKNPEQYRKNAKIELLYCFIQSAVALTARHTKMYLIGAVFLIIIALLYILVINPKYMNRTLTKRKIRD